MAFDKKTRNELGKMVAECRRLLTTDVRAQFQSTYGIQPDGKTLEVTKLKLDDRGREIAESLRQWLDHLSTSESGTDKERLTNAFDRMANETAFTYLNRFAALRMCEERDLIIECVRNGLTSSGFQLYERLAGQTLGDRGDTYRVFLECIFDELALDLGVLFDRRDTNSLVFPESECVEAVLNQLNRDEFKELWSNDETIGWVYQFFNSDEERKQMRKKSAAPRNSRELAVRNQFFTPRYVVEFLTDNTLGRTWYEMRQGETRLLDQMDYFVRHVKEVFLPEGQLPEAFASDDEDLSKEELLEQEVQLAYRAKKDPRDLKILDPACGSGHFLLYAFDLLETIYDEAWHDTDSPPSELTGKTLSDEFATVEELRKAVPRLVLENNLYGIDIDRRACQIAALALWLRAQRQFKSLKLKADDPCRRITKTNIVCAEPMPGEKELLADFIAPLNPPILRHLTESIFDSMNLAAEAGALLKIEEEIRGPLAAARKQWESQSERAKDKKGQDLLFTVGEMDELGKHPQQLLDLSGISDEQFWSEAEPKILAELRNYAASTTKGHSVQRKLFAEDAEQGFAFVDLCRQRYDVVLMNPPFGDASLPSKPYIDDHYGDTKGDVYKAFVEAFEQRLVPNGLLGIISNRSGFFKKDSTDWREQVVLRLYRPMTIADLGYFVLDAKVETAAYTLRALRPDEREQLTVSLLDDVAAVVAESGSPFSVAKYRDYRELKRYQAEQELELLEEKRYVRFVSGGFPQYSHDPAWIAAAPKSEPAIYPPLVAFRLLMEDDKKDSLLQCLSNLQDHRTFVAQPKRFDDLPNHSFAYWLNRDYRRCFRELDEFDCDERTVKQGLATADDYRFVRAWWEVSLNEVCPPGAHPSPYAAPYCVTSGHRWFPFSKGGKYSPFYGEIPHVINWQLDGLELRAFARSVIRNPDYYFRPGLTYLSRNTVRTCAMPLPAGCLFGHTGPGIFSTDTDALPNALARFSSYVADGFLSVSHGQGVERMSHRKQYEVGIMQLVPWPAATNENIYSLCVEAHRRLIKIRSNEESSRFFTGEFIDVDLCLDEAVDLSWRIDVAVAKEYEVDPHDLLLRGSTNGEKKDSANKEIKQALKLAGGFPDKKTMEHNRVSFAVGCSFGRWDVRFRLGQRSAPDLPGIFDPLPICSPGMFTDDAGLPATEAPDKYPISVQWDGILVDDAGLDDSHPKPNDIVRRVQEVLALLHENESEAVEQQIRDVLKLNDLRDYFRGSNQFFERHQKAYRKGGRDAPIYWPLTSHSGSYTLWIYYPRLTDQTLYTAVNKYVSPKTDEIERRIVKIDESMGDSKGDELATLRSERESCQSLLSEIEVFRDDLLKIASLPYKPDLNDGVMISAAPLWEMIGHSAWSKKLKACWKSLEAGEYDWAHLAFSIWPDRVRAAAEQDLSIAIAHGLATGEEIYANEVSSDETADEPDEEIDDAGDEDE